MFSSTFYLCVLALYEKESDKEIVAIYLEIIFFAALNELLIGGIYDYFYFILGMISVIAYLLSDKFNHKHLMQGIGVVITLAIHFAVLKNVCLWPELAMNALDYRVFFGIYNLIVTVFTVTFVSGFYLIDLASTKEKLKYASNHDTLTGLYNRRFLEQTLNRSIDENKFCYSIAMFDIDNFKKVNDTYGRDAGDRVLETISKIIQEKLQNDYLAIRWGGEEFILYMPLTNIENANLIVEEICDRIRNKEIMTQNCQILKVTATVGIASSSSLNDYEKTINLADEKLYQGKHSGKNCIVC